MCVYVLNKDMLNWKRREKYLTFKVLFLDSYSDQNTMKPLDPSLKLWDRYNPKILCWFVKGEQVHQGYNVTLVDYVWHWFYFLVMKKDEKGTWIYNLFVDLRSTTYNKKGFLLLMGSFSWSNPSLGIDLELK